MRVTTKGQVTIPVRIRGYLGITPHTQVNFRIQKGKVEITAAKPALKPGCGRFAEMRGILRGKLTTDQWMKATRGD